MQLHILRRRRSAGSVPAPGDGRQRPQGLPHRAWSLADNYRIISAALVRSEGPAAIFVRERTAKDLGRLPPSHASLHPAKAASGLFTLKGSAPRLATVYTCFVNFIWRPKTRATAL
jgi:hypothetical protein